MVTRDEIQRAVEDVLGRSGPSPVAVVDAVCEVVAVPSKNRGYEMDAVTYLQMALSVMNVNDAVQRANAVETAKVYAMVGQGYATLAAREA